MGIEVVFGGKVDWEVGLEGLVSGIRCRSSDSSVVHR